MAKWQHRTIIYKLALLFLYFIFLVFALSFSIATWLRNNVFKAFFGLWYTCAGSEQGGDFHNCQKKAFGDEDDWYNGVRGLWLAGMFLYVVTVLLSFLENCCVSDNSRDYGLTGSLAILAGVCGAVGVIVTAIKVEVDHTSLYSYLWGYMLACISSGLTIILGLIILITRNVTTNNKSRDNRTADYVFAHKQGDPYVSEYTNQGFVRDDIPLGNGVTYQHTPTEHPYTMYQSGGLANNNNLPHSRSIAEPGTKYYGYYNGRTQDPSLPYRDLSNGYTPELINAEHTLSRSNVGQRADYVRPASGLDISGRNDYSASSNRLY